MLHDGVIGTFNVESPEPRAFSESDLQFLEIFARDVAVALNTLELLAAEKASTAAASVEAIHSAVALPVDDILNDAVNVMERYIGHEPEVVERLQPILRNARDIKQVIQKVGQSMAPAEAQPPSRPRRAAAGAGRPPRAGGRCRRNASAAPPTPCWNAIAASSKRPTTAARPSSWSAASPTDQHYDVIIADIRLPDMSGYELLLKLKEMMEVGAAGADDRLRLRPGPFDRQGPPGRLAGGALQAVPARPVAGNGRAARDRQPRSRRPSGNI